MSERTPDAPRLLSGGNPQIVKGHGDEKVQEYVAAMPGWKAETGRALDALITRLVPGVAKAVRWNSPFYGAGDGSWFLSFHSFDRYLKVTFFRGTDLDPMPPVGSKTPLTRYAHLHEGETPGAEPWARWIVQAAAMNGVRL